MSDTAHTAFVTLVGIFAMTRYWQRYGERGIAAVVCAASEVPSYLVPSDDVARAASDYVFWQFGALDKVPEWHARKWSAGRVITDDMAIDS